MTKCCELLINNLYFSFKNFEILTLYSFRNKIFTTNKYNIFSFINTILDTILKIIKNQGKILKEVKDIKAKVKNIETRLKDIEKKLVNNFDFSSDKTFKEVII